MAIRSASDIALMDDTGAVARSSKMRDPFPAQYIARHGGRPANNKTMIVAAQRESHRLGAARIGVYKQNCCRHDRLSFFLCLPLVSARTGGGETGCVGVGPGTNLADRTLLCYRGAYTGGNGHGALIHTRTRSSPLNTHRTGAPTIRPCATEW